MISVKKFPANLRGSAQNDWGSIVEFVPYNNGLWYDKSMKEVLEKLKAKERYEQAMIDADIEGLARDPEAEALVESWDKQGIPHEEQIERLFDLYQSRRISAAE